MLNNLFIFENTTWPVLSTKRIYYIVYYLLNLKVLLYIVNKFHIIILCNYFIIM